MPNAAIQLSPKPPYAEPRIFAFRFYEAAFRGLTRSAINGRIGHQKTEAFERRLTHLIPAVQPGCMSGRWSARTAIGRMQLERQQQCVLLPFIDFTRDESEEIDPSGSLLKIATHTMCSQPTHDKCIKAGGFLP